MNKTSQTLIAATLFLLGAMATPAAEALDDRYKSGEMSVDLLGTGTIGQRTIDNLSGTRIRRDIRLGVGAGLSYFATRYVGVGVEGYSEGLNGKFLDDVSVNAILRYPMGTTGIAPFALAGVGRQFDPSKFYHGQLGAGCEFRLNPHFSFIVDTRYVMSDGGRNYGLGRGGIRWTF